MEGSRSQPTSVGPVGSLTTASLTLISLSSQVDTPEDVPARVRFARYRALKSFRTSPWDPKESLPRSGGVLPG